MMDRQGGLAVAGVLAIGLMVGCGEGDIGSSLDASAELRHAYAAQCFGTAYSQLTSLGGGDGDWFRLTDGDVELSDLDGSLRGSYIGARTDQFERLTRNGEDRSVVAVPEGAAASWPAELGRGSTVLFTASSSDRWDAHVVQSSFEVTAEGSVRVLHLCAPKWEPALAELAANHGTDVESILMEAGDPKRASVLADELKAIEAEPPGPADLPWPERNDRSMADPDVAPDVAVSATKVVVRVDAPKAWQIDGDAVDLVCSRSAGVMGVCTPFGGGTAMTAWSVGGAPIEVFLAGGPTGTEIAPVVDLPGPFTANTDVMITIDPERFPTPAAFISSETTIDPATVVAAG